MQVAKVGGSLLTLPDLPTRLLAWLDCQTRESVLLPGGGRLVDEIRRCARQFQIPDAPAHWLAVQAMTLQTHLLASLLPDSTVATTIDGCCECLSRSARAVLFDPHPLLWADGGQSLPASWEVTSDSIAAFLAHRIAAERLVLLKSVGGQQPLSVSQAIAAGWLDTFFPRVVGQLQVEWVNLRQGLRIELTR